MRGSTAAAKLSELEQALVDLAHTQKRTEASLEHVSAENKATLDRFAAKTEADLDRLEASLDRSAAELNRKIGEAANKAGRLVEDILAPGIEEFFCRTFHFDVAQGLDLASGIRVRRGAGVARKEFDAFVVGGDHFLLFDVKSAVRPERIKELAGELPSLPEFFPEARGRRIHGALACLYIDPSVVNAGERAGLLMIGLRPGLLDLLNSPGFVPRAF